MAPASTQGAPGQRPSTPSCSNALKPGKDLDLGAQVTAPTLPQHSDGEARLLPAPSLDRLRCLSKIFYHHHVPICSAPLFYPLLHI